MKFARRPPLITCTSCQHRFVDWQAWTGHRAENRDMRLHDNHTRYCLTPREWAELVLREAFEQRESQLV